MNWVDVELFNSIDINNKVTISGEKRERNKRINRKKLIIKLLLEFEGI